MSIITYQFPNLREFMLMKGILAKEWTILYNYSLNRYQWFSARLQYLQCISNGDTEVLH